MTDWLRLKYDLAWAAYSAAHAVAQSIPVGNDAWPTAIGLVHQYRQDFIDAKDAYEQSRDHQPDTLWDHVR